MADPGDIVESEHGRKVVITVVTVDAATDLERELADDEGHVRMLGLRDEDDHGTEEDPGAQRIVSSYEAHVEVVGHI